MTQLHMGRTFADMYSIFIPLQDTTAAMGATDACPGEYVCYVGRNQTSWVLCVFG